MFPQNITNERCSDFSPATLVLSFCRRVNAHSSDWPAQQGQGLRQRQLCPQRGALRADWLLCGLFHPTRNHGGDILPHHTGRAFFFVFVRLLFFATCICCNVFTLLPSSMSPPLQVLQRQATVFLYEAKTSSQQPLHTPAMGNTLQPPPSTFHLPQINTLAPPDSQGKHLPGLYCTCMSAGKSPTNLTNEFMVNTWIYSWKY